MPSTGSWESIPIWPVKAPSEPSTVAAVIEPWASGSAPASCAVRCWFHSSCLPPPRARSFPTPPLGSMGSLATLGATLASSSGDVLADFPPAFIVDRTPPWISRVNGPCVCSSAARGSVALEPGNAASICRRTYILAAGSLENAVPRLPMCFPMSTSRPTTYECARQLTVRPAVPLSEGAQLRLKGDRPPGGTHHRLEPIGAWLGRRALIEWNSIPRFGPADKLRRLRCEHGAADELTLAQVLERGARLF